MNTIFTEVIRLRIGMSMMDDDACKVLGPHSLDDLTDADGYYRL